MTDVDYADDPVFLANTPAQEEYQVHSLEQSEGGFGLYANANTTDFMCFKQEEVISTQSGKPLKLDKFTKLGSSISSTESDVNIRRVKMYNDVQKLLIISKSDLTDKIIRDFFPSLAWKKCTYACTISTQIRHVDKS